MGHDVRIQIYTMQSAVEAEAVAALGADHIGVTPSNHGLPGEVGYQVAADICGAVASSVTTVALSVDADLDTIAAMVQAVRPDILHLCAPPGTVGPADVAVLRRRLPDLRVMQAIAVTGSQAIDVALSYEHVADYLILDSVDPAIHGIGAAGIVHDWRISAGIVAAVSIPVVLAGGLSPENVSDAIATVEPWGVDSLTHTSKGIDGGGFRKDLTLVRRFVAAARSGENA